MMEVKVRGIHGHEPRNAGNLVSQTRLMEPFSGSPSGALFVVLLLCTLIGSVWSRNGAGLSHEQPAKSGL